jgi:hypothetical protein
MRFIAENQIENHVFREHSHGPTKDAEQFNREVKEFRNRMNGLLPQEREAEALVEIAIELKWLRIYVGDCDDYLNEIANKIS